MAAVTPLGSGSSGASGELIACRFLASSLVAPDGRVEVLRSSDGGRSWASRGTVWTDDGWCYRIPHIYVPPSVGGDGGDPGDGRLLMTGTRFETESSGTTFDTETGAVQRGEMFVAWSADNCRTWDPPIPVTPPLSPDRYACNGSGVLLILPDGRWMYPFETWLAPGAARGELDQKAVAVFSSDLGRTWTDMTVVADDPTGRMLYWDHCGTLLADGRIYETMWVHDTVTGTDLSIHSVVSSDGGRTWSPPEPTGLRGQASAPIGLPNGGVAVVYTHREKPEGIRVAVSRGLSKFDDEVVVFDTGDEALIGEPDRADVLATNMAQGFGKPGGVILPSGDLMVTYWGTVEGVSHTRWARVALA